MTSVRFLKYSVPISSALSKILQKGHWFIYEKSISSVISWKWPKSCITVKCECFFDCFAISLNLSNDTQHLSHQKTDLIFYIHKETNSPSSIGEQLPLSNESWSWKLSCNEKVFRESIPAHWEVLYKFWCKHKLTYQKTFSKHKTAEGRERSVIWLNSPYSKNVTTKFRHHFLKRICKYFPRCHKYHKLSSKNNFKVSYSCMPNIKSTISNHNKHNSSTSHHTQKNLQLIK